MVAGLKKFLFRGNVIGLAVAVVIGAAFGVVVTSFVSNILTPLIAAIFGKPDFSALSFTVNGSTIAYGAFLNALISFALVALAVYFFVVAPVYTLLACLQRGEVPSDPPARRRPDCLCDIAIQAR